jgi:hypothetical protein
MLRSQQALFYGEHLAVDLLGMGVVPLAHEAGGDLARTTECFWMLRS